ncbi:MAG: hypothetical protein Pg6B_09390 [Candidatus Azobacteroides pseudotrichonymphae]|nr:MAG: hypothetical protein Pg6B_09390 [Candidatus Azobacteroides pseudotrichonymphae]
MEINALANDIDRVLLKFKNYQIKDCNNEIRNIAKRIKTVRDKGLDSASKIDDFNRRKAVVDYQLYENSGLQDLVYMGDLNKAIGKWNAFDEEWDTNWNNYKDKTKIFVSKVQSFPCIHNISR